MELKATITRAGVIYLPIELRESFGRKVRVIPNTAAAVLYPADEDLKNVEESLKIILKDIQLRIRRQKKLKQSKRDSVMVELTTEGR